MDWENKIAELTASATDTGFAMSLTEDTGRLLSTLVASKPDGRFLELGTGVGVGTACILRGATAGSTVTTVEIEPGQLDAAKVLLPDDRVSWVRADAAEWLGLDGLGTFDLIFADAWPGKFSHLDRALSLLSPGGIYLIDDLLPQPTWPEEHQTSVDAMVAALEARDDLTTIRLDCFSGILIGVRTP